MAALKTPTRPRTVADLRELDDESPDERVSRALETEALSASAALLGIFDERRERNRLSKADLARSIDVERSAISRLLNDPSANPTISTLVRLLWGLGLHAEITVRDRRQGDKHVLEVTEDR